MRRGEIWYVNLDPASGAEIKKTRTAVIVSNDAVGKLPLKVIVPITEWNEEYANVPWMVQLKPDKSNGLSKESAADTFQVKSVSQERFVNRIGMLNNKIMEEIAEAITMIVSDI